MAVGIGSRRREYGCGGGGGGERAREGQSGE